MTLGLVPVACPIFCTFGIVSVARRTRAREYTDIVLDDPMPCDQN
jgi:hypothetical protein